MDYIDIAIDPGDVLSELDVDDVIDYYDVFNVLNEIEVKKAVEHYGADEILDNIDLDTIKKYVEENS